MVVGLPKLRSFAENIWKKALDRFSPPADKQSAKSNSTQTTERPATSQSSVATTMSNAKGTTATGSTPPAPPTSTTTTTPCTTTTTTAAAPMATKKCYWQRKTIHFTVFLAVFSTILSLLWVYTLTTELRRKAFDVRLSSDMARDRVLKHVTMDNPVLASYIRDFHLKAPIAQEPLTASETPEEEFIVKQLQGKRNGLYFEYMSRAGATSTTAWLESKLDWHGVMVFTNPRHFFDAYRSSRDPKTRVLHACLSTDRDTREIMYQQEADVQVTKLGEGPNSLVLPASRLFCFPLYTILLAYNATSLDYLNLDSSEVQDGLILDTIPWDKIRISVLSIHWGAHHTDAETKSIVDKLNSHDYKLVKSLSTGKLVFLYNRRPKI